MVKELMELYKNYQNRDIVDDVLPLLPIQYADYSIWQRKWLEGEILEKQLDYWEKTTLWKTKDIKFTY